jgi:ABC-2 type transport system permease protein
VRRYLKVLRLFWSTSIASELEYRINFVLALLGSLGQLAGNWFALTLFYRGGSSLGGWPFLEALLVMGIFSALTGLTRVLFTPNLSRLVEHVRTGTLDFVLIKPIDSQFWLSARRLSPWALPDFLLGVGVIAYAAVALRIDLGRLLLALGPLVFGFVVLYSLWFMLASIAIWYVKVSNVNEVLNGLLAAGRYPIDALPPGAYRFVFTFIVPVALLTTVPAEVALGRAGSSGLLLSAAFAAGTLVASRAFWRFALRYYTSASS